MSDEIAVLFLDVSCRKLDAMTTNLRICLDKLTDEQIWRRGGAHENAIGNLVLHLCGNMRQWILHGIGGAKDVRQRDAEFSATDGLNKADLIEKFTATVAEVREVIASLPPGRLTQKITPQKREVSVLEAIYQVVAHVEQHTGQIIVLTKQMIGTDLDLTMPRPR
ncbi:MAG TPA: DinB family protein [Edaphobacter sp.]|nr:DinB family protein [Edaphobacter sp.]